jgi:phage shock protein E
MKLKIMIIVIVLALISTGLFLFAVNKEDKAQTDINSSKTESQSLAVDSVIIDVRTPEEFSVSHAEGAINYDLVKLEKGELPNIAKDETIYVYCRSGRRSAIAKSILEKNGFKDIKDLGGLDDIQKIGIKLVGSS